MKENSQQRRYPRMPSENAVLVERLGETEGEEFVTTRTVGLGGCLLTSRESYGVGSLVRIMITIKHEVVKARARVVWEAWKADDRFEIGVEFLDLDDQDHERIAALFVDLEQK